MTTTSLTAPARRDASVMRAMFPTVTLVKVCKRQIIMLEHTHVVAVAVAVAD